MNRVEEDRIKNLLFEQMMKTKEEEKAKKVEEPKGKIHLYINKVINFLRGGKRGRNPSSPIAWKLSGVNKTRLEGLTRIGARIVGYGLIGGFTLSLIHLIFPPTRPMVIVELIRCSPILEGVVIILGSGSAIYLIMDLSDYIVNLIRGKR